MLWTEYYIIFYQIIEFGTFFALPPATFSLFQQCSSQLLDVLSIASIGSNCTGISVTVTELIALQRITEGLLFDTEVVAGPDICNNFGHAPVGKVT